ncbi:MAG: hypothetical protein KKC03_00885 [Bacteroidetes bacterium]|nr:hypothetical protein [Bacteroidota bacterium]
MFQKFCLLCLGVMLIANVGCRRDFDTTLSSGRLEFSRDTVYLDTVFTNIGSATFRLKVFNRSGSDIRIPTIRLAGGAESPFRLNVGGDAGKSFEDVVILERDSLFVFIETTLNINDFTQSENEFLVTDEILFDSGSNEQKVTLVSLVRDAIFLFPERLQDGTKETLLLGLDQEGNELRIEGFFLEDDELNFTNQKPYVIFGFAAIPVDKTLTIDAGARIHFHANSGLIAANGSTLLVNGAPSNTAEMENEVIFQGDRLQNFFSDIPGQWSTIWLTAGSKGHQIRHATIKNSTVGLLVESNEDPGTPTLQIDNTQIYNSGSVGLLGRGSHIEGSNVVIDNSGQISLFLSFGGRYDFVHSTFANFLNLNQRQFPSVVLTNTFQLADGSELTQDLTMARFENCIIDGNASNELDFDASTAAAFNFQFVNSLVRFENPARVANDPLFDFNDNSLYENVFLNLKSSFVDDQNSDLRITSESELIGLGSASGATRAPIDLLGVNRTTAPDLGAYQNVVLEENN